MQKALDAATQGRGYCTPNPAVGAVIVNASNIIQSVGYHRGPGHPHAEIDALQKIAYQAHDMTMYVTLEPCCHFGKTPPCTDALIKAGIKQVVYGYQDPNPLVAGKGAALLIKAGITCEHAPIPEINAFYESYHYWHQTKKPFITAKIAMTLDGKIAGKSGKRIQITGEALQELTHSHRKLTDAILTTAETIKKDNPKFNARDQKEIIPKHLYILDTHLSLPHDAAIFKTTKSITVFYAKQASSTNQKALEQLNVRCLLVDENAAGLDLNQVIKQIGSDGIHDLWIEAGGKCFSSFLKDNLLQRALIYIAPRWLGDNGKAAFKEGFSLADFTPKNIHWHQVGNDGVLDMRLLEYPH